MTSYIVNGYAYPSIAQTTLNWWLPRMSWLSTFSYGFTEEGNLIDLNDEMLIASARQAGVRPMMVLTPLDEYGIFNDNIATAVFDDPKARRNLIENIEKNIEEKEMGGVDFDFEYLPKEYAQAYVELVADTKKQLAPRG